MFFSLTSFCNPALRGSAGGELWAIRVSPPQRQCVTSSIEVLHGHLCSKGPEHHNPEGRVPSAWVTASYGQQRPLTGKTQTAPARRWYRLVSPDFTGQTLKCLGVSNMRKGLFEVWLLKTYPLFFFSLIPWTNLCAVAASLLGSKTGSQLNLWSQTLYFIHNCLLPSHFFSTQVGGCRRCSVTVSEWALLGKWKRRAS